MVGKNGRIVSIEPAEYAALASCAKGVALNENLHGQIEIRQRMLVSEGKEQISGTIYSSWPLIHATGDLHEEHKRRLMSTADRKSPCLMSWLMNSSSALGKVNALKLDVVGNEYSVLKGAKRMLRKFHPVIFMELLAPYVFHDEADFDGMIELLGSHGYQFIHISNGKKSINA